MNRWTSDRRWPLSSRADATLLLAICASLAAAGPAPAAQDDDSPLVLEIVALRHRQAAEAVRTVESLLTGRGTVRVETADNTLLIRDTPAAVRSIVARLRRFDVPPRSIRLEVQLVRAGEPPPSATAPRLAPALARRLRELLRYEEFRLLAQAGFEMRAGERISYQFGDQYQLDFELAGVGDDGQLRLADFIVARGDETAMTRLIHTNLNLILERPMVLGLAQTERSDRALMVVLTGSELDGGSR